MAKENWVLVGDNVEASDGGEFVLLRIRKNAPTRPSAPDKVTGISKSDVLASTRGNRPLIGIDGVGEYSLGVNMYKPRR